MWSVFALRETCTTSVAVTVMLRSYLVGALFVLSLTLPMGMLVLMRCITSCQQQQQQED